MKTDLKKEIGMVSNDSPLGKLTNVEKMVVVLAGLALIALASLDTPLQAFFALGSVVFWIGVMGMFILFIMPTELLPNKEDEHYPA